MVLAFSVRMLWHALEFADQISQNAKNGVTATNTFLFIQRKQIIGQSTASTYWLILRAQCIGRLYRLQLDAGRIRSGWTILGSQKKVENA